MGAIYKSKTKYSSSQYTQMRILPDAGLRNLGKVFQYIGQTTDSLTHGFFYECTYDNENEEYTWVPVNVQEASIGQSIQFNEMPEASQDLLGKIYQYTGETDENFNNGSFYKCIATEEDPVTYEWIPIIQESEDPVSQADINRIINSNLPIAREVPRNYSLNEQIIGTWVDGRTLYQRTFIDTTTRAYNVGWFALATLAEDVDEVIGYDGCAVWTSSSVPQGGYESFGFYAASNHYGYLEFAKDTKALNVLLITFSGRSWIKVIATIQYVKVESE